MSKRIESITLHRICDYDADTSDLGKYTDDLDEWNILTEGKFEGEYVHDVPCACDHLEAAHRLCDCTDVPEDDDDHPYAHCHECPCTPEVGCTDFDQSENLPSRGREYRAFKPYAGGEKAGTPFYIENGKRDYARARGLSRGDWCYVGIRAEAKLIITDDASQIGACHEITSPGLWGIESDSGESYFREVAGEELAQLKHELIELGFTEEEVQAAIDEMDEEFKDE